MVRSAKSGYVDSSGRPSLTGVQDDTASPGIVSVPMNVLRDAVASEDWEKLSKVFQAALILAIVAS